MWIPNHRQPSHMFVVAASIAVATGLTSCGESPDIAQDSSRSVLACLDEQTPIMAFWGSAEGDDFAGDGEDSRIWTIAPDGRFTAQIADGRSFDPWLTDDGTRLYFTKGPGGMSGGSPADPDEAWILNLQTQEASLLFAAPGVSDLEESPDGSLLAYAALSLEEGGVKQVFIVNAAEPHGLVGRVTSHSSDVAVQAQFEPTWSPDGKSLAYVTSEINEIGNEQTSVRVLDLGTMSTRLLYTPRENTPLFKLDWASDGLTLLVTETSFPSVARSINAATGEAEELARSLNGEATYSGPNSTISAIGMPDETEAGAPAVPVLMTWYRDKDPVTETLPVDLSFATRLTIADCSYFNGG